jgi:glutamate N-acetyltransferase/amino-acid N-acetyltransferase
VSNKLPKGFIINGVHCGLAKDRKKNDLALFYSQAPCSAAGMFTKNKVKAAPVILSMSVLKKNSSRYRAIVVNSKNANACTGNRGIADAKKMCSLAAKGLGVANTSVFAASTGVIGKYMDMGKISSGISEAAALINRKTVNISKAVNAIMTTDTFPKIVPRTFMIGAKEVKIWGCAKGAGMIHPDMAPPHATLLSFILTDALVSSKAMNRALGEAVKYSFNCVSVDGDTSTNDTCLLLANGLAGNRIIGVSGDDFRIFLKNLMAVTKDLAVMIARDGEGATKLVTIKMRNAKNYDNARAMAAAVATSPLVKTALFGKDANWGRILAACGRSHVAFEPSKTEIRIGNITVARKGLSVRFSESSAKKYLKNKEIEITVNLNCGNYDLDYFTCDLSFDYISINADYRS